MLTLVLVLVALLLPVLVLAEVWRTRRIEVPADAPDTTLDPVLSTSGMSRKIIFAMVALIEAFLLLIAYGANEPFRQTEAKANQCGSTWLAKLTRRKRSWTFGNGIPASTMRAFRYFSKHCWQKKQAASGTRSLRRRRICEATLKSFSAFLTHS